MLNYYNPHSSIAMYLAGHFYLESSSLFLSLVTSAQA